MLSRRSGPLPRGCTRCAEGSKMVLFITGLCRKRCFYCPVSREKFGKDVMYADEMRISALEGMLDEADAIGAAGTGITGGEPMLVPERVLDAVRLLRSARGSRHHIHLYTAWPFEQKWISQLARAGLDEIRFHPPRSQWSRFGASTFARLLAAARDAGMAAGVEVPALPGTEHDLAALARALRGLGASFLNLNELEFSESNAVGMGRRGYEVRDDASSAVKGSEEAALQVVRGAKMPAHFCSSRFKDAVQLRNRLRRRAERTSRPFEVVTDDGTLLLGIVEGNGEDPGAMAARLAKRFSIPPGLYAVSRGRRRVELAPWVAKAIARRAGGRVFIVEEYPTADRLEVEREEL